VPSGGLYRLEDLVAGEELLVASGLLREHEGFLFPGDGLTALAASADRDGCEALVVVLLDRRRPLWLSAATSDGILADELIPDEQQRILADVLDPAAREQLLLQVGRRFSDDERSATGALVEEYVVSVCRQQLRDLGEHDLAGQVQRVSLVSDELGYDVTAPRADRSTRRLECKGTRRGGTSVTFYLSRNEAERGLADPDWSLVLCRLLEDDSVQLLGHLLGSDLSSLLPSDPCPRARWQSARIEVGVTDCRRGLAPA
jgi:hypothetical protein